MLQVTPPAADVKLHSQNHKHCLPAAPAAPTSITCISSECQGTGSRRIPEKLMDTQPSLFVKSPTVTELL